MKALKVLRNKVIAFTVVVMATFGMTANPLLAGSSDFTGIYGALHASVNGVSMAGKYIDKDAAVTGGTAGAIVPLAGFELGVNLPLGPNFFVSIGTSMVSGEADVFNAKDSEDNNTVTVQASDYSEVYIQPSISIWDNTAVFVKYGKNHANLEAFGDVTSQPDDLTGESYGIGTQTMTNSGLFIKTEAGATVYDHFKMTGLNTSGNGQGNGTSTNGSMVEGDPLAAYGKVTIGFKPVILK
jgi:hypothetical protein